MVTIYNFMSFTVSDHSFIIKYAVKCDILSEKQKC